MLKVAVFSSSDPSTIKLERFKSLELMFEYTSHVANQGFASGGVIIRQKNVEDYKNDFEDATSVLGLEPDELDYVIELYDSFRE